MKRQNGAALIVVLSLLTISLMVGLSSIQSSQIDERLAGNYRAQADAQLAAEAAASYGLGETLERLDDDDGFWSSSDVFKSSASEIGEVYSKFELSVGDFYREFSSLNFLVDDFDDSEMCSGPQGCFYMWAAMDYGAFEEYYVVAKGYVGDLDLADLDKSRIESESEPILVRLSILGSSPEVKGAFTCFEEHCEIEEGGNSLLDGEDMLPPNDYSCRGAGQGGKSCQPGDADAFVFEGVSDSYEYPKGDVDDEYFPHMDASSEEEVLQADIEKAAWREYIDAISRNGFDQVVASGNLPDSPGRYPPEIISIEGDVSNPSNTNTSGIIIVQAGAKYTMSGTGHHEGLIIVEEGGEVDPGSFELSSGTPRVYGAVIKMEGEEGVVDLDLTGNMAVRYSSYAIEKINYYFGVGGDGNSGWKVATWR